MAHIAKPDSKPNNSLWASGSESLIASPGEPNVSYDIAIIGGGFSGLWSAFHLIKDNPNLKIAVFEGKNYGFGASGRNGGWVSTDYPVSRSTLEKRYGTTATELLFSALQRAIAEIGEFSRAHAPLAHFVKSGTVMFARNQAQEIRLRQQADDLHIWQSKLELEQKIRVNGARGGLFNPECATVDPMGLLSGLFEYLKNSEVQLFDHSYATAVSGGVLVKSRIVQAPVVIQATEAYGAPGRDFIPLYSQMVATEPISSEIWDEIGANERFTFAEGSHLINYAQRTSDNRLAIGGRGATYPYKSKLRDAKEMTAAVHENIKDLARRWFPQLKDVEFTHAWGGAVAITRQWEPYIQFNPQTGFGRIGGYAGDGVTMSYLAAKTLADLVNERRNQLTQLHFVNAPVRKWEFEPLRFASVNSLVKLSGFADKEEAITKRPSVVSKLIAPLILR